MAALAIMDIYDKTMKSFDKEILSQLMTWHNVIILFLFKRIPINLKLMVHINNFVHNSDTYDLIRP